MSHLHKWTCLVCQDFIYRNPCHCRWAGPAQERVTPIYCPSHSPSREPAK